MIPSKKIIALKPLDAKHMRDALIEQGRLVCRNGQYFLVNQEPTIPGTIMT